MKQLLNKCREILKQVLFGKGRAIRKIHFGLYSGLRISIDPEIESSYLMGTFEAETTAWLRHASGIAQSAVDIGSGGGELTVYLLTQRNSKRVLSFDPDSSKRAQFLENLKANNFQEDPRCVFHPDYFVPGKVIGELYELPEPILIKIDIDGGEEKVIPKLVDMFNKRRCLILLEVHSRELNELCAAIILKCGYQIKSITSHWRRCILPGHRPISFNQWLTAEKL